MKILIKLITISVILSSCAVKNTHTLGDLMQKRSYVELDINDIVYLGETEVSYKYSQYISFIPFVPVTMISSINGESPKNSVQHYVNLQTRTRVWGLLSVFEQRYMKRALYKAYLEFPNADYLETTVKNTERREMFLGKKVKVSATVKAYKYKYATK